MLRSLILSSFIVSATLVACGADSVPAPPVATRLTVNGLQNPTAVAGVSVAAPLSVRVTDAQGRGVPFVLVRWRVVAGTGDLNGLLRSDQSMATDNSGVSGVDFRPTSVGRVQVEASVAGLAGSPIVFSIEATPPPGAVIHFGPMFDCYGTPSTADPSIFAGPPSGKSEVSVIVGGTVEFIYATYLLPVCTARVMSSVEPLGGERIDSGILGIGGSYKFVARVPGTWKFSDVLNGGTGTLTAIVP